MFIGAGRRGLRGRWLSVVMAGVMPGPRGGIDAVLPVVNRPSVALAFRRAEGAGVRASLALYFL